MDMAGWLGGGTYLPGPGGLPRILARVQTLMRISETRSTVTGSSGELTMGS